MPSFEWRPSLRQRFHHYRRPSPQWSRGSWLEKQIPTVMIDDMGELSCRTSTSLKLTARTWNLMVGRLLSFWEGLFSERNVSFREGNRYFPPKKQENSTWCENWRQRDSTLKKTSFQNSHVPAPSKGCQLDPKGWWFDTLQKPFGTLWKVQVYSFIEVGIRPIIQFPFRELPRKYATKETARFLVLILNTKEMPI